jgi:CysZ protein
MENRKRLGFLDGVGAFFGGFGFLASRPSMWGWALVPVVVAAVAFGGLAVAMVLGIRRAYPPGDETTTIVLSYMLCAVGVAVAFLLALALAQPLSGFALDVIVRRQEQALGSTTRHPEVSVAASALRALSVTLVALGITLPVLALLTLVTVLVPPASVVTLPLKFAVTGLAVAYDFLDYPLSLHALGVRERLAFCARHFPAVLGFGLSAAALLLVPGIGLFVLPIGVAGATRLRLLDEKKR